MQFDYSTISDVVLHIRYTARDGGAPLRAAALQQIKDLIDRAQAAGSVRLFSVRHEFPAEWHRFKTQTPPPGQRHELALTLKAEHYPFWAQGSLKSVSQIKFLARSDQEQTTSIVVFDKADTSDGTKKGTLSKDPSLGDLLVGQVTNVLQKPADSLTLYFDDAQLSDLWIAVTWKSS
jgi:hypothetical protein